MVSGWDGAQTDGSGAREAETAGTPADVWFEIRWSGLSNGRLLAKGLSWLGVRWVGRAAAGRVKPHRSEAGSLSRLVVCGSRLGRGLTLTLTLNLTLKVKGQGHRKYCDTCPRGLR